MSDDLDDLVRRTMKTLDDQVPSGYFEALPNRTLARLEGKDMQSTTGTSERKAEVSAPPPAAEPQKERDEDSGLHDIRSLAQSTKQRLSKRVSTSPVRTDDDILAASSASWKGVALPEPAKMVSLPSIDELPSKKEIIAKEKAAKKAAAAAVELPATAPAPAAAAATSQRFANITQRKKSKAPLAIAGVLVAAAAGVAIYMATQQKSETKPAAMTVAQAEQAPAAAPVAAPAPPPPPKVAEVAPADAGAAAGAAEPQQIAVAEPAPVPEAPKSPGKHVATKSKPPAKVAKDAEKVEAPAPVEKKPEDTNKKKVQGAKGSGEEGEPSFDALLKEAGVDQTKKAPKVALANKSLSGSDFKKGMDAVQSKAQACYKGTQGTVTFKLSVSPTGQVSNVTVTGAFAGKPEGACVQAAVKSASFPAWDGGPQSFSYSYLLAE